MAPVGPARGAPQRHGEHRHEGGDEEVAPPARRTAQPHQARGLGGHAVDRNKLLLLTHRAEESQRMRAEADQAHGGERHQAQPCSCGYAQALARAVRAVGGEHEEGQRQPCRDLDSHTRDQGARSGSEARVRAGGERQCGGEQQDDQRVVVRAADGQHEQHRVQAQERHRPARRVTEPAGRSRSQRDRAEARGDRDSLQGPQPAGEPQRDGRVAEDREQRAVGRVLEWPSDEREDRVGGRFGSDMGVGVQAVQEPPCERSRDSRTRPGRSAVAPGAESRARSRSPPPAPARAAFAPRPARPGSWRT